VVGREGSTPLDTMSGPESLIGVAQTSSMRPSSAKYTFPRQARTGTSGCLSGQVTPGPADYDAAVKRKSSAAVFGTAAKQAELWRMAAARAGIGCSSLDQAPCDGKELKFPSAASAVFGTQERWGNNAPLVQNNPESGKLQDGPGVLYNPDYRKVRPRSAPAYSMGPRTRPAKVDSLEANADFYMGTHSTTPTASLGTRQRVTSRLRSAPAARFGAAPRFPPQRLAAGEASAECQAADPALYGGCSGARPARQRRGCQSKHRRAPSATFGSGPRQARTSTLCEAQTSLGRVQITHPRVPPQKELLRYQSTVR